MTAASSIALRAPDENDLDAINRVIEGAVMTWSLPERVKRLSLPLYRYSRFDLGAMQMLVAELPGGGILGVAAWEPADPRDTSGRTALLLHGLYVDPAQHRGGIGTTLFRAAIDAACEQGVDGLLVKAQSGAEGFFLAQGMSRLPVQDPDLDYELRYWLDVTRLAVTRLDVTRA